MEISSKQRLTPVTPIQLMQVNLASFSMMGIDYPEDVLSPLVSTDIQYVGSEAHLNVKMIALVPKDTSGKEMKLFYDESAAAGTLSLLVYFVNDSKDVKEYDAWYICYQHPLRSATEITNVQTYLVDITKIDANPKTKRGTVTQVLKS